VLIPIKMGDEAMRPKADDPKFMVRPMPTLLVCARCGVTFFAGVPTQEEKVKKPRVPQAKKGNKGGKK